MLIKLFFKLFNGTVVSMKNEKGVQ
jgi:hypothetical protein